MNDPVVAALRGAQGALRARVADHHTAPRRAARELRVRLPDWRPGDALLQFLWSGSLLGTATPQQGNVDVALAFKEWFELGLQLEPLTQRSYARLWQFGRVY